MFISVTFRILSFRTLPFIPQKKIRIAFSANYPFASFRIPQNTPSRHVTSSLFVNSSGDELTIIINRGHEVSKKYYKLFYVGLMISYSLILF